MHPRAQPEQLGGLWRGHGLGSGRPNVERIPRAPARWNDVRGALSEAKKERAKAWEQVNDKYVAPVTQVR